MPPPLPRSRGRTSPALCLAACAAAAALLGAACEQRDPWAERRRQAFERVAAAVNGPFDALRPLDERIAARGGGDVVLLDDRWDACLKAAPIAAQIEGLSLSPDEQGRPFEAAEEVRRAAGRFEEAIGACRGGQPSAAPPAADPACLARCMRSWSSLTRAAEKLRLDAEWVGARVQPVAPPADAGP